MTMFSITAITLFFIVSGCAPVASSREETKPITHEQFTVLLQKHVNKDGMVDYKGFMADREELKKYLDYLSQHPPNESAWSDKEQIAYWINAYNAFTIELILKHHPVESIKDIGSIIQIPFINTPWDIKFINIGTETYDLNNIEHGILRKKWKEPRIHFALNCASFSCPRLRREAYEVEKLDEQLHEQAMRFINNDKLNDITAEKAQLSKIFSWYRGDFEEVMSLRQYINQYAEELINESTAIAYKEYNWELNDQD